MSIQTKAFHQTYQNDYYTYVFLYVGKTTITLMKIHKGGNCNTYPKVESGSFLQNKSRSFLTLIILGTFLN